MVDWNICSICFSVYIADQWRNNSRKNEEMEPKQKQHPVGLGLVIEVKSDGVKSNIA